jgi:hypothetical protein
MDNDKFNGRRDDLLKFIDLYKLFLADKHGESVSKKFRGIDTTFSEPIISVMLQEQMLREIQTSFAINQNEGKKEEDVLYYIDLLFYSEKKIENLPDRLEFNRAIQYYLNRDFRTSNKIILELKTKKRIKQKENPLYLDLLFLEALCQNIDNEYDPDSMRSIQSLIKIQKKEGLYEEKAYRLLMKWKNKTNHGQKTFHEKYSKELDELKGLMNKFEVMQNIIYLTLMNRI